MSNTEIEAASLATGGQKHPCKIGLFETLILFIFSTSITSVLLLILNHFSSIYAIISGFFLTVLFLQIFNCKIVLADRRFDRYITLILLIAVFFNAKPYLYVMGGQDEGLYVNMSSTYERTGSTFIKNNLWTKLSASEKKLYDAYNHYHLGIYPTNKSQFEYVYQFYPLHPIWMAIFGKILGSDNRVYSIVFFSLISIVAFFLIAYEISGRKKLPGYLIALFLATNPLFSFFSKFPLSEIVSVAFSSLGFYYLLRYYKRTKEGEWSKIYLFLSLLSFSNLFFVHIAGFLYMPIFYLLLLLTLIYVTDYTSKKHLIIYYFFVFLSYFLSIIYGLNYSPTYSRDIYRLELGRLLVFNPTTQIVLAIILTLAMPFIAIRFHQRLKSIMNRLLPHLFNLLALLIVLLIPWNLYQAFHSGIDLQTSSSYITMLYLTPFGVVLFLLGLNKIRKWHKVSFFLFLVILLLFWLLKAIGSISINYQYYASRYLFSEVLVYFLLLVALYGGYLLEEKRIKRWFGYLLITCLLVYSIFYTTFQLRGQEADGSNQSLKLIATQMDEKDLLLSTFSDNEITTPLTYYFGLNVFVLTKQELANKDLINNFLDNFNDIFVLSNGPLSNTHLETVNIISYKQGIFEHPSTRIPRLFFYHRQTNLYLYKISRYNAFTRIIRPANYPLTNFYEDQIWTNGNGVIAQLELPLTDEAEYVVLKTGGHSPLENDIG
ncbi:hypothetical protein HYV57_00890 [Candidatus Peregrinibacteria bacterium]|nr:hypothetical protein [Candidatus Peregrinibacteria bacterium]